MDKLLNLLSEFYGENWKFSNENGLLTMTNGVENLSGAYAQTYIISLKGGFIQRLVEQDKIDISKLDKEEKNQNIDICIYKKLSRDEENTERLLMLLSIQENPISFLLNLLKDD